MRTPADQERHLVTTTGPATWVSPTRRVADVDAATLDVSEIEGGSDPFAGEPKWPAWKVTLAVVIFCGAFWTGVGYIAMRLLG